MVDGVRRKSLRDPVVEAQRRADLLQQEERATEGEFKKGLRAGMHGLESSYYGLKSAGQALIGDEEEAVDSALEAKRLSDNAAVLGPEISDLSQIESAGDVSSYVTGVLGQALPSIATAVAGGGVGGIVAKTAAKKLAERQVKKAAGEVVKKQVQDVAMKRGAQAGAFAVSAGLEAGAAQQSILDPANRAAWESVQRGERVQDARSGQKGHVLQYVDGDSFMFQPDDGSESYEIRLPHVNTADVGQEGKDEAGRRLEDITRGQELSVLPTGRTDKFGRQINRVYTPGSDLSLSEQLLQGGAASVHPGFPGQENLYRLEREGRAGEDSLPNFLTRHQRSLLTPEQLAARDARGDIPDPAQSALGRPLSLREQTFANILGPGVMGGALEAVLPTRILGKYGVADKAAKYIKADTGVKKALAVAKNVGKEAVKGAPLEGATEGLQQAIQRATANFVDENKEILGEEGVAEILNATAAGAIGGLYGGAGGFNVRFKDPEVEKATADLDARIEEIEVTAPEEAAPSVEEVGAVDLTPEERAAFGFDQAFDPLDPGFEQIDRDLSVHSQNFVPPDQDVQTQVPGDLDEPVDAVEVSGSPIDFNESQALREINPFNRNFTDNVTLTPEANQAIGGKPVPAGKEPGIVTKARKLGKGYKVTSLRDKVAAESQKQFPGDPQAQTEFVRSYAEQLFNKKDGGALSAALEASARAADNAQARLEFAKQTHSPDEAYVKELQESLAAHEAGVEGIAQRMEKARDHTALYDPQNPSAFLDHFQTIEAPETARSEAEFDLSDQQLKRITRSVTRDYKPSGSSVKVGDKAINLQRLVATMSAQMHGATQDRGLTRNLGDQLLTGLTLLAEKGVIQMPAQADNTVAARRQAARELLKDIPQDTVIYRGDGGQVTVGQALKAEPKTKPDQEFEGDDRPQITGKETGEIQPVAMQPVKRDEHDTFVGKEERFELRKDEGQLFAFDKTLVTREEVARFRSAGKAAAKQISTAKKLVESNPRQAMLEARNALKRFGVKDETIRKQIEGRPTGMSPAKRAVDFAEYVLGKQRKELAEQQEEVKTRTQKVKREARRQEVTKVLHKAGSKIEKRAEATQTEATRAEAAARAEAASDAAYARVGLKPPGKRQAKAAANVVTTRKTAVVPRAKTQAKKVDDKLIKAVHSVVVGENYERLNTAEKVLSYAKSMKEVHNHLRSKSEDSRTDLETDTLYAIQTTLPGHSAAYGFDWDMLFDGLNPTDAQRKELHSIVNSIGVVKDAKQFGPGINPTPTKQLIENGDPAYLRKENAILKTWAGALGLKQQLEMVSVENLEAVYAMAPDPAALRRRVESGAQYGFALKKGSKTYVFVHPNIMSPVTRIETLAHEVGHVVINEQYRAADKKTKDAIWRAYKKWRKGNEGKTVAEIRLSAKAYSTAQRMTADGKGQRDVSKLTPEQQQYLLDFDEWFADQVSRWLTTDAKPRNAVELFFGKLAVAIRELFGLIKKEGFVPDSDVAGFLDSLYTDTSSDPVLGLMHYLPEPVRGSMADLMMHPGVSIHDASVRAALYEYLSVDELKAADRVFSGRAVRNQVRSLLKKDGRDDAAKELMRNPEAAIAYAYDYWMRGDLKLGPKGNGIMSSLLETAKTQLGVVRQDKRAESILESFRDGLVLARVQGEVDFVIPPTQYQKNFLQKTVAEARDLAGPVSNLLSMGTFTAVGQMRRTGNGWLRRIADMYAPQVGAAGEREGFHEARRRSQGLYSTKVQQIFEKYEDDSAFGPAFAKAMNTGEESSDPAIATVQREVWALLADMRNKYLIPAGVKLGTQGKEVDGAVRYWPNVYNREYLAEHFDEFVSLIEKHASDELLSGRVVFNPKTGKKEVRRGSGELSKEERLAAAQRIAKSVFEDKGSGDGDLTLGKTAHRPFMSSFDMRMLSFIPQEDIAPFLDTNPGNTLHTYIDQAVKRAEFVRRFGADGDRLDGWLNRAVRAGATPNQIKMAHKFIAAQMGTLGADKITPAVRQGMGAMMVFQNVRTLSMALFSSLVDPLGILVRSGDVMASVRGFKEGIHALVANAQGRRTEMEEITEALGAIESHVINDALNWEYGGVFLGGKAARINNALFKYTGLSDWTRSTRIMATYSAMEFIKKHATKPGKHSSRYLDELGLTAAYVKKATKNGELDTIDPKIQVAINRWVDDAILRPNASQRPIWGSDPRFMLVFHLKQFTYSFYDRIMRRAWTEFADHKNMAPAMAMLAYVPGMILADLLRDALKDAGGDFDDDRKDEWTLSDYTWQATQRAGLLGVGQFAFDAQEAAEMGKPFFLPWAGPTADWAHSIYGATKTGNWSAWAAKQYPGQNLVTPLVESF